MVWQSDFTCIETAEGWLFLAIPLNGSTRQHPEHEPHGQHV